MYRIIYFFYKLFVVSQIPAKPEPLKPTQDSGNKPFSILDLDSPLRFVEDSVIFEILEEDFNNDEIPAVSTSGSDQDNAVLESNQLKAIYEEEATDEDPEIIPNDDSYNEEVVIPLVDKQTQEQIIGEFTNMAAEESNIPVISITTTDDNDQTEVARNPYQASPEPLTDLEDLDHDTFSGILKIDHHDEGSHTDAEVMEASDDEKDLDFVPNVVVELDDLMDYGGTYEELARSGSPKPKHKKGKVQRSYSLSNPGQSERLLNVFYEKEGVTDNEDFDVTDEEDNADEDFQYVLEDDDDILARLMDDENVNISDSIIKSPVPSPCVTPEPGQKRQQKKDKSSKKSKSASKKKSNYSLLSPRSLSPHLSDITDTEIVYSDSDEEKMSKERPISPQERRRLKKDQNKQKVLQTSNHPEGSKFPKLEISSVRISEKIPSKGSMSESDTDHAYLAPRKHVLYAPKKKTLLMEVAGALMKDTFVSTDVEHFEGSNDSDDETASQVSENYCTVIDGQCSSVDEKEIKKNALRLPKQDRVALTDTEDIETDDESTLLDQTAHSISKTILKRDSTDEDEFEASDSEYVAAVKELRARAWKDSNYEIRFIEVDGKARPLAITPDITQTSSSSFLLLPPQVNVYTTDTEDLEEYTDIDQSMSFLNIHIPKHDGGLTDTEDVEDEEDFFRPKSPEPSDDENSQVLPEPTREMILMKEDPSGRPVSVVLPLGNVLPEGLKPAQAEFDGGVSEVEDMMTDDDDLLNTSAQEPCPTPDLSDFEGGTIHSCEAIKVQKKKLKVFGEGLPEPLTDTEDIFLSACGKRRRSKVKSKLGLEVKSTDLKQDLTDTEDIIFSDAENQHKSSLTISHETEPVTDLDDVDLSGEEEAQDFQRSTAVTPDYIRELGGDSYTQLKEGSGPFSDEARQNFLTLSNIPVIMTISPTPDILFNMNTDTEDMFTSADEDGFSRAETMTPYDTGVELEDQSSFVYMKHTRKFDLEAPEEAMHVKGAQEIHDTYTDVEDLGGISEDERPKPPEQLFVNDTVNQVCVCLNSEAEDEDSVCVCVSKEHGGLSLVWNSKNSTDTKQHRGTLSVQLTSHKHPLLVQRFTRSLISREDWAPFYIKNPYVIDSSTTSSKLLKTSTSFMAKNNKYLLIEDHVDSNYLSFYLYIESVSKPSVVKVVFKLSISLTPVGFATKVVISQRNPFPSNIACLVVYYFKTLPLPLECFETKFFHFDNTKNVAHRNTNDLPIVKEVVRKTKRKVQNRAWSGSDILETQIEDFERSKPKSVSVSKLISRFEYLSIGSTDEDYLEKYVPFEVKELTVVQKDEQINSETVQDKELDLLNHKAKIQPNVVDNPLPEKELVKFSYSTKSGSTFKPIIPIIPLKDRSVSPCRLDPASIRDSPAFKALCKRARGAVETLAHANHTKPTEDPKKVLVTSYRLKRTVDFFKKSSENRSLTSNADLVEKIQAFETLSGSQRLRRNLILKRNSETELSARPESLSSTNSTSFSDLACSSTTVVTLIKKTTSSNTIDSSEDRTGSRRITSIRRTSSCPISHWVGKGNRLGVLAVKGLLKSQSLTLVNFFYLSKKLVKKLVLLINSYCDFRTLVWFG